MMEMSEEKRIFVTKSQAAAAAAAPSPRLFSLNRNRSGAIRNASNTDTATSSASNNNNNNAAVTRGIINRNNLNLKSIIEEHETKLRNGQQQQQQQQQSHYLSDDVFNKENGRIDFSNSNDCLLQPPPTPPHARHIKRDGDDDEDDNNNNVLRYNRCFPSPSSSSLLSVNNSTSSTLSTDDHSVLDRSGILHSQNLDSFLDLYEHKHGLEPLNVSQVQGLLSKLSVASLLLIPPQEQQQQTANNATDEYQEWHTKKTEPTFLEEKDSQQIELIPSRSHLSSSDLSRLLAATFSDDDIQDKKKNLSNNSSDNKRKDFVNIFKRERKRGPLSTIKEESESEDTIGAAKDVKNAAKDTCQNKRTNQNGIKDTTTIASTTCNKPRTTETLINTSRLDVSNTEVKVSKPSYFVDANAAKNKTSNSKKDVLAASPSPTSPRQQKPQQFENSKIDDATGRQPGGENNTPKKHTKFAEENINTSSKKSVVQGVITSQPTKESKAHTSQPAKVSIAPVSPPKRSVPQNSIAPQPLQFPSSTVKPSMPPRNTVAQKHQHHSDPPKSKIPVSLQKTKSKTQLNKSEVTKMPIIPSKPYVPKIADSNNKNTTTSSRNNNTGQQQQQVQKQIPGGPAEKVGVYGETNAKNDKSNNRKLLSSSSKKESPLPSPPPRNPTSTPTTPVVETTGALPNPSGKDPPTRKLIPLRAFAPSPDKKNGAGDEVVECLGLIDGLSGHTTWVMNKVLEFPVSKQDAINRIKKLNKSADIGDFFGVPYISNGMVNHLHFKTHIPGRNNVNFHPV